MSNENEKPTIPPPSGEDDDVEDYVEERTVLTDVPEELIAESLRGDDRKSGEGGLRQMFSRDPDNIRSALPTEAEGDALLDMLFDDAEIQPEEASVSDAKADDFAPTVAKSGPGARGALAPPLPPPLPPRPRAFGDIDPEIPSALGDTPVEPEDEEDEPTAYRAQAATLDPDAGDFDEDLPTASLDLADPNGGPPPVPRPAPPPLPAPRPPPPRIPAPGVDAGLLAEEPAVVDFAEEATHISDSTVPISIPSRPPTSAAFQDEREASAHLVEKGQRDLWAARAAWLREEAEAVEDKASRARALLVVSELEAMAGEDADASAVANELRELAPALPMCARQYRGLLSLRGDWSAVLEALDNETRMMPTPVARCHGAWLGAEIARVKLGDWEGARKRVDQALRALPTDPRGHVERFCEALASTEDADGGAGVLGKLRPPDGAGLASLSEACAEVAAQRAAAAGVLSARGGERSAYASLLFARGRLETGDLAGAVSALWDIRVEALTGGAGWLRGLLSAARKETRPAAVEALRSVVGGSHGAFARRALAGVAIEVGGGGDTSMEYGESFSPADRVALAALTGASRADTDPILRSAAHEPELGPLTAAASAAIGHPADEERRLYTVGGDRGRAAAALGRVLAMIGPETTALHQNPLVTSAIGQYATVTGSEASEDPVARALSLEIDVEAGAAGRIAAALATWGGEGGASERDRSLAAALIAELAGEGERAQADYDRARVADPSFEAAVRAEIQHVDSGAAARLLGPLAEAIQDPARSALLLSESGIRWALIDDFDEAEAPLTRAAEIDPKLPVAIHLGERIARSRGDRERLVDWLRIRREASDDPIEQAHDLVREALLVSDGEGSAGALLLEKALSARPADVGLRDLYERLAPEPPADRASWREARVAGADGPEKIRFALEAAYEYERQGDLESAGRAAKLAIAAGDDTLAPICALRYAMAGHGTGDFVDQLLPRARSTTDDELRRDLYEQLADLDERGRNDLSSGLLWRRAILEEKPQHLPTLRRVTASLITAGRDEEIEPFALEIAKALDGPESVAHAALSARLRMRASWDEAAEPVAVAYSREPRTLWALRQMGAHARAKGDHTLACEADRQLIERTHRPSEVATLSLRAAESATLGGALPLARSLLQGAVEVFPDDLVVRLRLAEVLAASGDLAGAADSLEAAADAAATPEEKASCDYNAAVLWQEVGGESAKARAALERVLEVSPGYKDIFERLQAIYVAEGARVELADLLKRRLDAVTDPEERVEMEVLRGKALAEVGDPDAAKRALAAALEANPDHVQALAAFADLCMTDEDWSGAEQAFIRLVRLVSEPARQAEIYLRLGELYDDKIPNTERAELAYQEILKRLPQDSSARERLVALYMKSGQTERALEQQNVLLSSAESPDDKCLRTIALADIYEAGGDQKKAEATLVQARKSFPKSDLALMALVRYYQRTEQGQAANVLLDRAAADARRALGTGRFEPFLFETLGTVAELRGRPEAARIAQASVAALAGQAVHLQGAGARAGDPKLDDLLAPEVMTPAFRELLRRTGPLLDTAVPYDLSSIRATPLPPGEAREAISALASAYGLSQIQVHVTGVLGSVCIAASAHPPTIVIGEALLASPNPAVLMFLVHRALKVIQANAAAFARTAPIDLWPLLAAYLKAFNQNWQPQGVDAARLTDAYGRISRAMPASIDPQVQLLSAEVIGSIGNRASTLNTAINGWGDRAGLLALGDPNVALLAIACAGGHSSPPPEDGKQRLTWVGRNAEARELIVFSVSDPYAEARARLGLTG